MDDVHRVDLTISAALSAKFKQLRNIAFNVALSGEVSVKAWPIA